MFCFHLRKNARSVSSFGCGVTSKISSDPLGEKRNVGRESTFVPAGGSFRATFISANVRSFTALGWEASLG